MFYIDGHEKIHIFQPFFSSFGGGTLLCRPQGGGGYEHSIVQGGKCHRKKNGCGPRVVPWLAEPARVFLRSKDYGFLISVKGLKQLF